MELYEQMMSVNYLGTLYSAMAVAPLMKQQSSGGRLMFVSSLAGLAGKEGGRGQACFVVLRTVQYITVILAKSYCTVLCLYLGIW